MCYFNETIVIGNSLPIQAVQFIQKGFTSANNDPAIKKCNTLPFLWIPITSEVGTA
uniref:Uncharacterized protein n=1 Tax=Arundo donax TaxID=35708 RepID=A0A0A9A295_ARUDO